MARFLDGYTPNASSAKSASQILNSLSNALKSVGSELKTGIVGNTVTTHYPVGDRGSQALGGAMNDGKIVDEVNSILDKTIASSSGSGRGGGGGYGGGGFGVLNTAEEEDPYDKIIQMVKDTTKANNEWSAAQAQKQMDFQKMMSDTAHQREIVDLQKAGLNPVLSAGGSGASTPSGAMGDTDTSGTRVIAEIAMEALNAMANTASGAVGVARRSVSQPTSFLGKLSNLYASNKLFKQVVNTGLSLASSAGRYGLVKAILR